MHVLIVHACMQLYDTYNVSVHTRTSAMMLSCRASSVSLRCDSNENLWRAFGKHTYIQIHTECCVILNVMYMYVILVHVYTLEIHTS